MKTGGRHVGTLGTIFHNFFYKPEPILTYKVIQNKQTKDLQNHCWISWAPWQKISRDDGRWGEGIFWGYIQPECHLRISPTIWSNIVSMLPVATVLHFILFSELNTTWVVVFTYFIYPLSPAVECKFREPREPTLVLLNPVLWMLSGI